MMENRSFDNVLGWLYDNENKPPRDQKFEGVFGKNLSNPRSIPPDGSNVPVGKGTAMTDPYPDPNEPYNHVYSQMYGVSPPPQIIPNTPATPSMNGFVVDYANAIQRAGKPKTGCNKFLAWLFRGNTPMDTDPGVIMNCFAPKPSGDQRSRQSLRRVRSLVQFGADANVSQSFVCARGHVFRLCDELLEDRPARMGRWVSAQ
jgi:hypothetical protein